MTHFITRACCIEAVCVPVCPVNFIRPTPDEPDYGAACSPSRPTWRFRHLIGTAPAEVTP